MIMLTRITMAEQFLREILFFLQKHTKHVRWVKSSILHENNSFSMAS